jgi:molecular chaperone GrpE (heat shock protein)
MTDTQSQPTITNHTAEEQRQSKIDDSTQSPESHLQAMEALVAKMSDRIEYLETDVEYLETDVEYWRNRADGYRRMYEREMAGMHPVGAPLGGNG